MTERLTAEPETTYELIDQLQREKAKLVAALEECVPWLESMPLPKDDQPLRDKAARDLYNAQAAIAKAKQS